MDAIRTFTHKLCADARGATAIEYGLLAALISVACLGAMQALGGGVGGKWGQLLATMNAYM